MMAMQKLTGYTFDSLIAFLFPVTPPFRALVTNVVVAFFALALAFFLSADEAGAPNVLSKGAVPLNARGFTVAPPKAIKRTHL